MPISLVALFARDKPSLPMSRNVAQQMRALVQIMIDNRPS